MEVHLDKFKSRSIGETNLNNEQLKIIADGLEEEINKYPGKNWKYDERLLFINSKTNKGKQRNRRKGKRKPRIW